MLERRYFIHRRTSMAFISATSSPFVRGTSLCQTQYASYLSTTICDPPKRLSFPTTRRFTPRASIETDVSQAMKSAMKAKDTARLKALKSIRAAFLTALKSEEARDALPDSEALAVLRKLAKMRKESIDMFVKGGREDMADDERAELSVIEEYLPQFASEEQMKTWAQEAIEKTGASGPSDMGKVMGVIMKSHRDEVDGNVLRQVVSGLLKS